MTIFRYSGRTKTGELKKGTIDAPNRTVAVTRLRERGINPREIAESTSILHKEFAVGKVVKQQEFVLYCRQFATLVRAGVTVVDATSILTKQMKSKGFKKVLANVEEDLRGGLSFSEAAAKHPKAFPAIFVNMMHAGEVTGNIDGTLERLADSMEKQYRLKKKVQSTLIYPMVLLVVSIIVTLFLMIYIVPTFLAAFEDMDVAMPPLTLFVLGISDFLIAYWWLMIIALIAVIVGFNVLYKFVPQFNYSVNLLLLRMPIFGPLIQKSVIARMMNTLSSLFSSAVPILQALNIVEKVVGNPVIERVVVDAQKSLEQGQTLAEPLERSWLFPPLVTQMTAIGERTGSLDYMLEKVSDFYEDEVERAVDTLKSLIEPTMILFLAAIVGTIVVAILQPMFTLYENM